MIVSHQGFEFPQYTRPAEFRGMKVPDVALVRSPCQYSTLAYGQSLRKTWSVDQIFGKL